MSGLWSILLLVHLLGLILAVGAATVKIVLLLKSNFNPEFLTVYLNTSRSITPLIITGMILLTVSGIILLLDGYPFSQELIIKLILVGSVWVLGPIIDNVLEPKFRKLAPVNVPAADEFKLVRKKYVVLEIAAATIFYIIVVFWMLK